MTAWPVIVFGAPGAIVGLVLCVLGLLRYRPSLLVAGAFVLVPSTIYLVTLPGFRPLLLLPLLPLAAAFALGRRQRFMAGLLLIPNAAAVLWLTAITLSNLMAI